jgi:hypothetical protein
MAQLRKFGRWAAAGVLLGMVLFPAAAAPPDVDAKGLPAGFTAAAIGTDDTLTDKQTVSVENGVFTIQAGGVGLGGEADGGIFVHRTMGNGSFRVRLVSQADAEDDGLTQTGIAIRESLEPGSPVLRLNYTSGNQLVPEVRTAADAEPRAFGEPDSNSIGLVGKGTAKSPAAGRAIGSGIWLGVDREDSTIRFYWSEDGQVWNPIGRATTTFAAEALVGIEASKHGGSAMQTSRLDNVTAGSELIAPRSLSGVSYAPRDASALITWNPVAVTGADVTYNVYSVSANGGDRKKLTAEPIKTSSFLAEGLTNGTKYYFGVTAVVNGVESGLQMPEPNSNNQNGQRRIGMLIPGPAVPVAGGLQMHYIGIDDPATATVTGTGDAAKITFRAAGTNVWQTGDGVPFLAIPVEGDVDVSARLVSGPTESEGGGWEHGGVMIRESLDPGARFVYAEVSREMVMEWKRRRFPAQQNTNTGVGRDDNTARPVSVRIIRKGDNFEGFYSNDNGTTWLPLGDPDDSGLNATNKDTLANFPKTAYIGLTLCPHFTGTEGAYTEAEFDQVVIKKP